MADQIDFSYGNVDDGEASQDAISPIQNGEDADETVLGRPDDALRNRTEVLRQQANISRWLHDIDRGAYAIFVGGGYLSWDSSTGELTLTGGATLNILPLASYGKERSAFFETGDVSSQITTSFAHTILDDGASHEINVRAKRYAYEGGNEITITIVDDPGGSGSVVVEVAGNGTVNDPGTQPSKDDITATYNSGASHTVEDVITAINNDVVAGDLVELTYAGSGSASGVSAYEVPTTQLEGGLDGHYFTISDTELAAFFSASADNALDLGDTLALWFETVAQRRAFLQVGANAPSVTASRLVNLSREPEKAANCIPICKHLSTTLFFTNGAYIGSGTSASSLGADPSLREDLYKGGPTATLIPGANSYGSEILGVDTSSLTNFSPADGKLQTVLESINSEYSSLRSDVDTNTNNSRKGGQAVNKLQLVDLDTVITKDYGFRYHPKEDAHGTWGKLVDTTTFASANGVALCTDGQTLFAYDNTDIVDLDLFSMVMPYSADPTLKSNTRTWGGSPSLYATGSDAKIDCNGYVLAVGQGNNIEVYQADDGSLLHTYDYRIGSNTATLFKVVVRRDRLWAFWVENVGSNWNWYAQAFVIPQHDAQSVVYGSVGSTSLLVTSASSSDYSWIAADAKREEFAAIIEDNGTDEQNLYLGLDMENASPTYPTARQVGDTTSDVGVREVMFLERGLVFVGENIGMQGIGIPQALNAELMLATGEEYDYVVDAQAAVKVSDGSSGWTFYYTCSDGRFIYNVLWKSGENANTIQVYDSDLTRYQEITCDTSGDIVDLVTDGAHLYVLFATGELEIYGVRPQGGVFGYDPDGRAPAWTMHQLMHDTM